MSYTCRGFRFFGGRIGIKKKSKKFDFGLIHCPGGANAAALFTKNRVVAAPVKLSRTAIKKSKGRVTALAVNSGNANACTGKQGDDTAAFVQTALADALETKGQEVLVASTGVIGLPLETTPFEEHLPASIKGLSAGKFEDFAKAILTTDKRSKIARRRIELGGARITILACTKGAGMIAPNMATTLSYVCTDADLPPKVLDESLRVATNATFNALTIDGDTSTNDMVLLMASGKARNRSQGVRAQQQFTKALKEVMEDLALQLMHDGEGVHHVVRVVVDKAPSDSTALAVAKTIANSPLVKTAIAGADPNWGRVLAAAGRAGVAINPDSLDLYVDDVQLSRKGQGIVTEEIEAQAQKVMKKRDYTLRLSLNEGKAKAHFWTCDLSKKYVEINADYRS